MAREPVLISTRELADILDSPDVVVLDVRSQKSYEASDLKIKGAVRRNPAIPEIENWAGRYPKDKTYVAFCA